MVPALQLPAQRPVIWQKGLYQRPEALRVVVMLRVAELMDDHIVDDLPRPFHQPPGKAYLVFPGAGAPPGLRAGYLNSGGR